MSSSFIHVTLKIDDDDLDDDYNDVSSATRLLAEHSYLSVKLRNILPLNVNTNPPHERPICH